MIVALIYSRDLMEMSSLFSLRLLYVQSRRGLAFKTTSNGITKFNTKQITKGIRMKRNHLYSFLTFIADVKYIIIGMGLSILLLRMELTNAISMEGYLEKESPNIIKIFQKRYFAIISQGQYLVWFKKKPDSAKDNPKGVIPIVQVKEIIANQDDQRIFSIKYSDREFILRAETENLRNRWVHSLQTIINQYKKINKNRKKSISIEQEKQNEKSKSWRFSHIDTQVNQKIRVEHQKLILTQKDGNILQQSMVFLSKVLLVKDMFQIQSNIVHGFNKKKGFLSDEKKWYVICSEFSLYDQNDQNLNQKVKPLLQETNLKSKESKKPKHDSSSDEDQSSKKSVLFGINKLYEFSVQTYTLTNTFQIENIVSWTVNTAVQPFQLTFRYNAPKVSEKETDENEEDEEMQLILINEYLSQIQKWVKAFEIIYQKYSIKNVRAENLEKRFEKFQIKCWKMSDQTEWRILGTTQHPEYLLMNRDMFKIIGHNFELINIDEDVNNDKFEVKIEENNAQKIQKFNALILSTNNKDKIYLIFAKPQIQKKFKKKLKKMLKRIESNKTSKKQVVIAQNKQKEVNLNTYYMDKVLKQNTSSIKMNFYQMMDRQVAPKKNQKSKDNSFFGKIMAMFCAPAEQQDYLS